jgi:hypothetical protein
MDTSINPAPRVRSARSRGAFRLGLAASACLGVLGLTTGAAQAIAGAAIANDSTFALANPAHRDVSRVAFGVHQYGTVTAASAHNQAEAESVACSTAAPCRSISLSFQIVTMAGEKIHLNAVNLSHSQNQHCDGCETLAGAYQFIVSTPGAFSLSQAALAQLARIHTELNALGASSAPVAQLKASADALAARVTTILNGAAAAAPRPLHPLTQPAAAPVTVHRMFDQG